MQRALIGPPPYTSSCPLLVISFIYKKVPFLLLRVLVLYAKLVLAMGGILNEIISFASLIATGTARGGGCGLIYQTLL